MRKIYTSVLALAGAAFPFLSHAQGTETFKSPTPEAQAITRRVCGTMEVLQAQLDADPAQAQRMAAIEAYTQRLVANPALRRNAGAANATTSSGALIIPVVVHVLYRTAAENISDAQVQSQIDVLNED